MAAVPLEQNRKFPAIDGLRAVAIAAVVGYHIQPHWLPAGYLGVDIFFVISGFLVSLSSARFSPRFADFFSTFYARRLSRIVPPLVITIFFTALFAVLFIPDNWLNRADQNTAALSHIGLANIGLLQSWNDYFSPRAQHHSFTHMWSLAIEEQFYFLFPFIFLPWLKYKKYRTFQFLILTAVAILSLLLGFALNNKERSFFLLETRFWELGAGVLTYQASQFFGEKPLSLHQSKILSALSILAFSALLFVLWFLPSTQFPNLGSFVAVGSTVILLCNFQFLPASSLQTLLTRRSLRYLGRLSYSLYLFHWPVLVLMLWTIGIDTLALKFVAVLLPLLLAAVSYKFIERPISDWKNRTTLPSILVITAMLSLLLISYHARRWFFDHRKSLTLVTDADQLSLRSQTLNGLSATCDVSIDVLQEGMLEVFTPTPACSQTSHSPNFFVLGDSHASAHGPMLKYVASNFSSTVRRYAKGACPFIGLAHPSFDVTDDCQRFLNWSREEILKQSRPGDILFLSSLRVFLLAGEEGLYQKDFSGMIAPQAIANRELATLSAAKELEPFVKKGLIVILEAPLPVFRAPIFRCLDWFNQTNPVCEPGFEVERDNLLSYRLPVVASLDRIRSDFASDRVYIWDPFPILCPANTKNTCSALLAGHPLFLDTHHLSSQGSLLLLNSFDGFVRQIISK